MEIRDAAHNIEMLLHIPSRKPDDSAVYKCDVTWPRMSEPYDSQTYYNWTTRAVSKAGTRLLGGKSPAEMIVFTANMTYLMAIHHKSEVGGLKKIKESLKGLHTLACSYRKTAETDPEHQVAVSQLKIILAAANVATESTADDAAQKMKKYLDGFTKDTIEKFVHKLISFLDADTVQNIVTCLDEEDQSKISHLVRI